MRYLVLIGLLTLFSCSVREKQSPSKLLTDDLGREVWVPENIEGILSLSPALTEVLYFACPDSLIVGRTQACNFPPEVYEKPEISTYPFDIEGIISINPDLIITEEGITSPDQLEMMERNKLNVYVFRYSDMSDIFAAIREVGGFCACRKKAGKKVDSLQREMTQIRPVGEREYNAMGLIWADPIYVYGKNTLFSAQLQQIGIRNAVDSVFSKAYPEISREYFLSIDPDIIYGPSFEFLDSTLFNRYPELKRVSAYKNKRIYEIDGDILTRPGPRSVEALKLLKSALNEE